MAPKAQPSQEVVREMVLHLHSLGTMSLNDIAKHPSVKKSRSTVQYIIKRFANRVSCETAPKAGRPPILSHRCGSCAFLGLLRVFSQNETSTNSGYKEISLLECEQRHQICERGHNKNAHVITP